MLNIINRLFNQRKAVCPRCLGKGKVDLADIQRLKMELYWREGTCAYCAGSGKVMASTAKTIRPDLAYLTTETPLRERLKLFNRDENALKRALDFEAGTEEIIKEIERLYFNENIEPASIAEYFSEQYHIENCIGDQRTAMIEYIGKVIQRRLNSG